MALVLKPGVMGGPEATFELARTAARLGLQVALSSCMETREGLALLRELARAVDVQVFPDMLGLHGLGTDGYVGEAVAEPGSRPGGDLPSSARSPEGDRRPRATGSDLQGCAGLAIHCRRVLRHGCESEGGAAGTLVLLHGFLGAAEDWTPVAASLGTRRTVLAPDLPGHGSAGLLTGMVPPSLEQAAADVAGWCATLQQPVTLVGYSLGARLALTLALRHPGACSRLVLVSGSPGLEGDALGWGACGSGRSRPGACAWRMERDDLVGTAQQAGKPSARSKTRPTPAMPAQMPWLAHSVQARMLPWRPR